MRNCTQVPHSAHGQLGPGQLLSGGLNICGGDTFDDVRIFLYWHHVSGHQQLRTNNARLGVKGGWRAYLDSHILHSLQRILHQSVDISQQLLLSPGHLGLGDTERP